MKTRKKRRDESKKASSGRAEFHRIECPGCGVVLKKLKKQKETVKHSFECSHCETRFSLTFPGTDAEKNRAFDFMQGGED